MEKNILYHMINAYENAKQILTTKLNKTLDAIKPLLIDKKTIRKAKKEAKEQRMKEIKEQKRILKEERKQKNQIYYKTVYPKILRKAGYFDKYKGRYTGRYEKKPRPLPCKRECPMCHKQVTYLEAHQIYNHYEEFKNQIR